MTRVEPTGLNSSSTARRVAGIGPSLFRVLMTAIAERLGEFLRSLSPKATLSDSTPRSIAAAPVVFTSPIYYA